MYTHIELKIDHRLLDKIEKRAAFVNSLDDAFPSRFNWDGPSVIRWIPCDQEEGWSPDLTVEVSVFSDADISTQTIAEITCALSPAVYKNRYLPNSIKNRVLLVTPRPGSRVEVVP